MSAEPPVAARALSSDEFRNVIGHFATGVTVITTSDAGDPVGTTASAVSSLSMEPPMMLVCMNQTSATGQAIGRSQAFAVNILAEGQDDLARHFASKNPEKFAGIRATPGRGGQPLLDGVLASLECRVVEQVSGGTHVVFIGEVDHAVAGRGTPLAYFRGRFGRLELDVDTQVYARVRGRLLDGSMDSQTLIDADRLAEELSVDSGPLSFVFGRLVAEGLLEQDEDGLHIPPVSPEDISDALRGRCAIELGVVAQTIGRLSADELDGLRDVNARWKSVSDGSETVALSARHAQSMDFHDAVVSLAGSSSLLDAYRQLRVPSLLAGVFHGYELSEADEAYGDHHQELVDAFARGDGDAARSVVLDHSARIEAAAQRALRRANRDG